MAYKGITSIIRKKTKRKGDHKHGLKLSKPILKQTIINPHSPLPLPCYPVFNSPKKHLIKWKTQHQIKVEKKNQKHGNIPSIMGCNPRNG